MNALASIWEECETPPRFFVSEVETPTPTPKATPKELKTETLELPEEPPEPKPTPQKTTENRKRSERSRALRDSQKRKVQAKAMLIEKIALSPRIAGESTSSLKTRLSELKRAVNTSGALSLVGNCGSWVEPVPVNRR